MSDYISKQSVINHLKYGVPRSLMLADDVIQMLESMPTVDVAPVKHGYWKNRSIRTDTGTRYCSVCDYDTDVECISPYCPECGTKMDADVRK